MTQLLVRLPLLARALGFEAEMADMGLSPEALTSVTGMLSGLNDAISKQTFEQNNSSDAGELARAALLESLSVPLRDKLPTLFERLCRKVFQRLSECLHWTHLSGEGRELLERRHTVLTELPLADHVRGFDPCQCCGC